MEKLNTNDASSASITRNVGDIESIGVTGRYTVECRDADGNLKWADEYPNLVTNVGKADMLTSYFKNTASGTFFLGLVSGGTTPTYNAGDTMASHAGWTESTAYSNANRVTAAFGTVTTSGGGAGAAGTGSVPTSAAVFNMNATATIAGCFLTTSNTKAGTTGVLFSCGSFSGGNRSVANGDTLNVTYTATN